MPQCEICGMEVETTQNCKSCDSQFCPECGDNTKQLCYDCLGWREDINPQEELN
ncbi:hypothetical protein GF326_04435 [Candidatus Bathyarchaeota archaeon]|nr:hypothetical protein [Candidatus Bathyarchaeota archaeon]